MSITVITDVFCDFCPQWIFGTTSTEARKRFVRWHIKQHHGWERRLVNGKMRDICPDCQTQLAAGELKLN